MQVSIDSNVIRSGLLSSYFIDLFSNGCGPPKRIHIRMEFRGKENDEKYFKELGLKYFLNSKITGVEIGNNKFDKIFIIINEPNGTCKFLKDESSLTLDMYEQIESN